MFRSILAARTRRVLLCFWRSIPKALAASFVLSLIIFTAMIFFGEKETAFSFVAMYMDEFNLPTDDAYITSTDWITGIFSNSAASRKKLNVSFLIDKEDGTLFNHMDSYD